MFKFQSKGFATEINARRVLANLTVPAEMKTFVAVQDGRFFPVLIYRDGYQINIPFIASKGVHIVN